MPIILKTSHHTINRVEFQEHNSSYPLLRQQHDIPVPKGVTPFARTAPSWKRAFPGRPRMHTIELVVHNRNTHHKLTKFTLSKI